MSRSGYYEGDGDPSEQWALIRWRGAVTSAIRGKRGQAFLQETLAALDALAEPALIGNSLAADGGFCTLGAVGHARGLDMAKLDADDWAQVADAFGIPEALARAIMYENDEFGHTPRDRYERMRRWVVEHLAGDQPSAPQTSGTA